MTVKMVNCVSKYDVLLNVLKYYCFLQLYEKCYVHAELM